MTNLLYRREIDRRLDEIGHLAAMNRASRPLAPELGALLRCAFTEDWRPGTAEQNYRDTMSAVALREDLPAGTFAYSTRDLFARDLTPEAGSGGYLVATSRLGFGPHFREQSVLARAGAVFEIGPMPGTLARTVTPPGAAWLRDSLTPIPNSAEGVYGQVAAVGCRVGTLVAVARDIARDPAALTYVADAMRASILAALDVAALAGSGADGQPTGVLNTSGVGVVSGTSLARAGLIQMQRIPLAAGGTVDPSRCAFIAGSTAAETLATRETAASSGLYHWEGGLLSGRLAGAPAMASSSCPAASLAYGEWSELRIRMGEAVSVEINPYGADFRGGSIQLRIILRADVIVTDPRRFAIAAAVT